MNKRAILLVILAMVLAWTFPAAAAGGQKAAEAQAQAQAQADTGATLKNLSASVADLVKRVRPSVVQVRTVGYGLAESQGAVFAQANRGMGSGAVIDSAGFIVTNAHVVRGARSIEVWLYDPGTQPGSAAAGGMERRSAPATLVGIDLEADLAVIKIDRTGLVPLVLGDSDALRQGQIVFAFGNPLALENSVTMGVVSSTERQLRLDDPAVFVQTDAPINPGNSGGPLVDVQGRLVGLNTFILSQSGGSEGMGFAIPSNTVGRISAELRKVGHMHHGRIGIIARTVTPSLAAGLKLPRDWGVILEDVEPQGPAERAGLMPGDLVTTVDGAAIREVHQLYMAIDRHTIGEALKIGIQRGTDKLELAPVVDERPDDPNRFLEMVTEKANLVARLGILAIDLNDELLRLVTELRKPAGVVVAARVAGYPAGEEGLAPGDLIISLNGATVPSVEGLRGMLDKLPSGSAAVLQVQREERLLFIVVDTL